MRTDSTFNDARRSGQAITRSIDLIVIHCSATPSGRPLQQGTPGTPGYLDAVNVINVWHAVRGFKRESRAVAAFSSLLPSIGYHYVIDLDGSVVPGRHLNETGAHAAQFNANSVGICLVGGAERDARYTMSQWKALQQLAFELMSGCGIPRRLALRRHDPTHPLGYRVFGGVCGHRDLSPDKDGDQLVEPFEWTKTCPGFDVGAWLARGMTPTPNQVCEVTQ